MKQNTFLQRIAALFSVLTFIPLLFSSNNIKWNNNEQTSSSDPHILLTCDVYQLTEFLSLEELLPTSGTRISHFTPSKRLVQPKCLDYCFEGVYFILFAASILFIALRTRNKRICFSRRYIIKYIHNQDGIKITPPFCFKSKTLRRKKDVKNSTCYNMCFNFSRNGRIGCFPFKKYEGYT